MKGITPKFLNSPYLVGKPGNWGLREDAPEDLKKELRDYTQTKHLLYNNPASMIELNSKDLYELKNEIKKDKKAHIHY